MLSDVHVFEVEPPYFTRGMNGDIVELRDGRLLYAFCELPDGRAGIYACCSEDRGKTWSEPAQLLSGPDARFSAPGGEWVGIPSFLRRSNGQLMMAYVWSAGRPDPFGHSYYRFSDDEGETWSDPKVLTPGSEHICQMHNDKLLRLSGGRILAPAELRVDTGLDNDHRGFVSTAWYSDDDGHTWHRSDNDVDMLEEGVESQEPHLVELKDGRVLMLFRTYSGYVGRADSGDHGQTWSRGKIVQELQLPMNSSALHVRTIPRSGRLVRGCLVSDRRSSWDGDRTGRRTVTDGGVDRGWSVVGSVRSRRPPAHARRCVQVQWCVLGRRRWRGARVRQGQPGAKSASTAAVRCRVK